MEFTIDDCEQYIINSLREGLQKNKIDSTKLSHAPYDIKLIRCVESFMCDQKIPDPENHIERNNNYSDHEQNRQTKFTLVNLFSDAFFQLVRKGILRPGERFGGNFYITNVSSLSEGFTVTEYGKEWVINHQNSDLLPSSRGRLESVYNKFQPLFGAEYFRRAKEAVSCYFSANYLACCVMSGAATESILLTAAFIKTNKDEALKIYKTGSGRRRLENLVFGQTSQYIKDRYSKYTDLINYWRDESAHGAESEIDSHEAYIALLSLLRYAEFMQDHWSEITD